MTAIEGGMPLRAANAVTKPAISEAVTGRSCADAEDGGRSPPVETPQRTGAPLGYLSFGATVGLVEGTDDPVVGATVEPVEMTGFDEPQAVATSAATASTANIVMLRFT
jgi:hypothetical protein